VEGVSFSSLGSPSKLNIHEEIALRNLFEESRDPLLSSEHFPIVETALDSFHAFRMRVNHRYLLRQIILARKK
jgi:hypothetical protein